MRTVLTWVVLALTFTTSACESTDASPRGGGVARSGIRVGEIYKTGSPGTPLYALQVRAGPPESGVRSAEYAGAKIGLGLAALRLSLDGAYQTTVDEKQTAVSIERALLSDLVTAYLSDPKARAVTDGDPRGYEVVTEVLRTKQFDAEYAENLSLGAELCAALRLEADAVRFNSRSFHFVSDDPLAIATSRVTLADLIGEDSQVVRVEILKAHFNLTRAAEPSKRSPQLRFLIRDKLTPDFRLFESTLDRRDWDDGVLCDNGSFGAASWNDGTTPRALGQDTTVEIGRALEFVASRKNQFLLEVEFKEDALTGEPGRPLGSRRTLAAIDVPPAGESNPGTATFETIDPEGKFGSVSVAFTVSSPARPAK